MSKPFPYILLTFRTTNVCDMFHQHLHLFRIWTNTDSFTPW